MTPEEENEARVAAALGSFFVACIGLQKAKLTMPALALCFTSIDVVSSLNRTNRNADASKRDFEVWVDSYLLPNPEIPFSAQDLYAARCGMLHTCSPESNLWRKGKATLLAYGDTRADVVRFQKLVRENSDMEPTPMLSVEALSEAVASAIRKYLETVKAPGEARTRFLSNAGCVFGAIRENPEAAPFKEQGG